MIVHGTVGEETVHHIYLHRYREFEIFELNLLQKIRFFRFFFAFFAFFAFFRFVFMSLPGTSEVLDMGPVAWYGVRTFHMQFCKKKMWDENTGGKKKQGKPPEVEWSPENEWSMNMGKIRNKIFAFFRLFRLFRFFLLWC